MKKLIINLVIFLLIIFSVSFVIKKVIYSPLFPTEYSWGAELIHKKKLFLIENKEKFNTLFLGSSLVFRQINPAVFDSIINKRDSTLNVHSFNFGVPWLASSELLFLLNGLTEKDSLNMKYIFVELQKIKMVNYTNYFTTRIKYWYTWDGYWFTVKASLASNLPLYAKAAVIVSHTINYIAHVINFGYFTEAAAFKTLDDNQNYIEDFVGNKKNGFISYDEVISKREQEVINNRKHGNIGNIELLKTNQFQKDTSAVTTRMQISKKAFQHFDDQPQLLQKFNHEYADKLNALIKEFKKKGINLVLFLPPRLDRYQYYEVIPLFNAIDPAHRINLSDARMYHQFYLANYSNDVTHMNEKGAELYSEMMAENFLSLIKKYSALYN